LSIAVFTTLFCTGSSELLFNSLSTTAFNLLSSSLIVVSSYLTLTTLLVMSIAFQEDTHQAANSIVAVPC
jgi:hypothetical protein